MAADDENEANKQATRRDRNERDTPTRERDQRQATEATEITPITDAIDTAATGSTTDRNRHAALTTTPRQATGSSNPGRTTTETQTASPAPTCRRSGEPGRYDDKAKRDKQADSTTEERRKAPTREARTGQAKQERSDDRTRSHEATDDGASTKENEPRATDDDTRQRQRRRRPAKHVERAGRGTRRERARRAIPFVLIAHRAESRGVPSITRPAPFSQAPRKPQGRMRGKNRSYEI